MTRLAILLVALTSVSSAADQAAPATLGADRIAAAISEGTSAKKVEAPHITIKTWGIVATAPIYVFASTPFSRVLFAASEAKRTYRTFAATDVTPEMLADTLVLSAQPLVLKFDERISTPQHLVLDCGGKITQPSEEKVSTDDLTNGFGAKRQVAGVISTFPLGALQPACIVRVITDRGEKVISAADLSKTVLR